MVIWREMVVSAITRDSLLTMLRALRRWRLSSRSHGRGREDVRARGREGARARVCDGTTDTRKSIHLTKWGGKGHNPDSDLGNAGTRPCIDKGNDPYCLWPRTGFRREDWGRWCRATATPPSGAGGKREVNKSSPPPKKKKKSKMNRYLHCRESW